MWEMISVGNRREAAEFDGKGTRGGGGGIHIYLFMSFER